MAVYDIHAKRVDGDSGVFEETPIQLFAWDDIEKGSNYWEYAVIPIYDGMAYCPNPYHAINQFGSTIFFTVSLLDENKEVIPVANSDGTTVENFTMRSFDSILFDGTNVVTYQSQSLEGAIIGQQVYATTYTIEKSVSYLKLACQNSGIKWGITEIKNASDEYIPESDKKIEVKEDIRGYWEQFNSKVAERCGSDDIRSLMRCEAVRQMNLARDCIRVGTFNMFVQLGGSNRDVALRMFADFGIDFVGTQETPNYMDGYPESFTSATLPYIDNGETATESPYLDNKVLSRYPISSTTRVMYSVPEGKETREWRGYTRCEIQLPRYKDYYPNGDKVLAFYATHFDPDETCRLSEVQQLTAVLMEDTADFIVVAMDSNDFNLEKPVWKVITDAGFKKAHDGSSKTVVIDKELNKDSALDNIFCSSNMDVVGYNIINSSTYQYTNLAGTVMNASDHDFVYADLKLNYEL